jgi:hypothetical protein
LVRCIKIPITSEDPQSYGFPEPEPGKAVIWNAGGDALENSNDNPDDILPAALAAQAEALANATAAANYAAALKGTSVTSLAIATGSKVFTTQTGKQFNTGQFVIASSAANAANYMWGQITSYSGSTLTVNVITTGGSGTLADWNIAVSGERGAAGVGNALTSGNLSQFAATTSAQLAGVISNETGSGSLVFATSPTLVTPLLGTPTSGDLLNCVSAGYSSNSFVRVNSGNGYGSTNNKIRRFSVTESSGGSDITYADSAADGASFTINTNGLYEISFTEYYSAGNGPTPGISVNSNQLTTIYPSITASHKIGIAYTHNSIGGNSGVVGPTRLVRLVAGDVIRPHTDGVAGSTDARTEFYIRRVA